MCSFRRTSFSLIPRTHEKTWADDLRTLCLSPGCSWRLGRARSCWSSRKTTALSTNGTERCRTPSAPMWGPTPSPSLTMSASVARLVWQKVIWVPGEEKQSVTDNLTLSACSLKIHTLNHLACIFNWTPSLLPFLDVKMAFVLKLTHLNQFDVSYKQQITFVFLHRESKGEAGRVFTTTILFVCVCVCLRPGSLTRPLKRTCRSLLVWRNMTGRKNKETQRKAEVCVVFNSVKLKPC